MAVAHTSTPVLTGERLLAVVGPGRDPEPVLRWARSLADTFHSTWVVLYLEPARPLGDEEQSRITKSLSVARELGADVVATAHEDPVVVVLRMATQRHITQIILHKPVERVKRGLLARNSMVTRLLRESGSIGIHLVPTTDVIAINHSQPVHERKGSVWREYVKALAIIGAVAVAAYLFRPVVGTHAAALIFLLTVVLLALFVGRGPTLVAAAMSALLWDYFFLPPIYAFRITNFEDTMLLGMYFVVALVLGHLTTRIRAQEEAERQREIRATALYLLTRDLSESVELDQMVQRIIEQLESCFQAEVWVATKRKEHDALRLRPHPYEFFLYYDV